MKVLAIIDMQKDFIDGALGTKEAVAIVPAVAARLQQARSSRRGSRRRGRTARRSSLRATRITRTIY